MIVGGWWIFIRRDGIDIRGIWNFGEGGGFRRPGKRATHGKRAFPFRPFCLLCPFYPFSVAIVACYRINYDRRRECRARKEQRQACDPLHPARQTESAEERRVRRAIRRNRRDKTVGEV